MTEKLNIHFSKEDIIAALEDYYAKTKGGENKINISFDPNNGLENAIYDGGLNVRVICFINESIEKKTLLEGKLEENFGLKGSVVYNGNWFTSSTGTGSVITTNTNSGNWLNGGTYIGIPQAPLTGKITK